MIEDSYPKTVAPSTLIYTNNQGTIKWTQNPEYYYKTKLIPIKYHKMGKLVNNKTIQFKWIPMSKMVVDNLIKSLERNKFKEFIYILGFRDN